MIMRKLPVPSDNLIKFKWKDEAYLIMDLSEGNLALKDVDLNSQRDFTDFIFGQLRKAGVPFGVGGYAEKRGLYARSDLFEGEEPRTIHLGIDIWGQAGTPVHAPLDGSVHSFANNALHGDYGPTIILRHEIDGSIFHTLYGHLSAASLTDLHCGMSIKAGKQIGSFGTYEENFHWPPHLHFQVILDIQDHEGDYPGVCKESEKSFYLNNCPDPSTLLGLPINS